MAAAHLSSSVKLTEWSGSAAGLSTEQMLMKDRKLLSGSLNLAVSVLYVSLEVSVSSSSTLLCPLRTSVTAHVRVRVCVCARTSCRGRAWRTTCQTCV